MDYKNLLETYEKLSKKSQKEFTEFIDDVSRWWSQELKKHYRKNALPVNGKTDPDAKIRYDLYYSILELNLRSIYRDDTMSSIDFEHIESKVKKLRELQLTRKLNPRKHPHPSLWYEYAKAAMRADKLELSEKLFIETLQFLELDKGMKGLFYQIDKARIMGEYIRCLYKQDKFDEAKILADKMESIANQVDASNEKTEMINRVAIPFDYFPIRLYTYFVRMDLLINNPNWEKDLSYSKAFKYYRRKSVTEYNTPKNWHPLVKIIICTDKNWVTRNGVYVKEIAEELYIKMGKNWGSKIFRRTRIQALGLFRNLSVFNLEKYSVSKAAAILCLIAFLSSKEVEYQVNDSYERTYIVEAIKNKCEDLSEQIKNYGIAFINKSIPSDRFNPLDTLEKLNYENQLEAHNLYAAIEIGSLDIIDM